MLHLTQIFAIELSQECNLSNLHRDFCPINCIKRAGKVLTDEKIIDLISEAHDLGFEGYIMWSVYNEPMIHHERMFDLMEQTRELVPKSRFLLWTNGTILIEDQRMKMFEKIIVTNYLGKTPEELKKYFGLNVLWKDNPKLDERMNYRGDFSKKRCTLPFDTFLVSNNGDVLFCCIDWKNEVKLGNVFDLSLKEIDENRWRKALKIIGKEMCGDAPDTCLYCTFRWELSRFDEKIANKALEEINKHV